MLYPKVFDRYAECADRDERVLSSVCVCVCVRVRVCACVRDRQMQTLEVFKASAARVLTRLLPRERFVEFRAASAAGDDIDRRIRVAVALLCEALVCTTDSAPVQTRRRTGVQARARNSIE